MEAIGREFIERTKFHYLGPSDQMRGEPMPDLERAPEEGGKVTPLPNPGEFKPSPFDLRQALEERKSVRRFVASPLSLEELSYLLWCTQGVKRVVNGVATMRTVPSAGARHALETYLLVNRVRDLKPALYRYLALSHRLVEVDDDEEVADRMVEGCLGQTFVKTCGVTFVWTAEVYRMSWRYGQRGYRYLFLDAGHVCQNLYLAARSTGCGVCAIAAFSDDDMNRLLNLNGEDRFVIYLATAGKT
jgi:SagB-type dehydrogenase family enzyme